MTNLLTYFSDIDISGHVGKGLFYGYVTDIVQDISVLELDKKNRHSARRVLEDLTELEHFLDKTSYSYGPHHILAEKQSIASLRRMETWNREHIELVPWIIIAYLEKLEAIKDSEDLVMYEGEDKSAVPQKIFNMQDCLQRHFRRLAAARVIKSHMKSWIKKLAAARIIQAYYRHWTSMPDSRPCKRRMIETAKEYGMKP